MNLLETIMNKILPQHANAQNIKEVGQDQPTAFTQPKTAQNTASGTQVNVDQILTGMESKSAQKLDWRNSIVDLMKMVGMDSDLASRKQLAKELHYTGDMNDSAKMNIWLHQQVMLKLEQNGGKIPDGMKH